jgi:hypothetical protein
MAKGTDQAPNDPRAAINQALGRIARDGGLSSESVRRSSLLDLLHAYADEQLRDSLSAEGVVDLIVELADDIQSDIYRLGLRVALRVQVSDDDLSPAFAHRMTQWTKANGLRDRICEMYQHWKQHHDKVIPGSIYARPVLQLKSSERATLYETPGKWWTNGRDELAGLLLRQIGQTTIHAMPTKPTTQTVTAPPPEVKNVAPRVGLAAPYRPISLSSQVRKSLTAAYRACEARERAFRTADLLLALLDLPGGYVADCFDAVESGLAKGTRAWLVDWTSEMTQNRDEDPPRRTWAEHPAISRAWELVAADGGPRVNEVYILLGVLDGHSNARRQLEGYVDLARLRREAESRSHLPDQDIASPDPMNVRPPVPIRGDGPIGRSGVHP